MNQESQSIMATNEEIVRQAYATAEIKDVAGFTALFTANGIVRDMSVGAEYRGKDVRGIIDVYARAFPAMHRELYQFYNSDNTVVVELSLNGIHEGPLELTIGTISATGKEMHAPCCDVWRLEDGKIAVFDCYSAATVILGQLGVLNIGELAAA
jgi:ketosteroid isomerase-like protein